MDRLAWLPFALPVLLAPSLARADPPPRFDLLVLPVDFIDEFGTIPSGVAEAWEMDLEAYFDSVSNGELDLNVTVSPFVHTMPSSRTLYGTGASADVCMAGPGQTVWQDSNNAVITADLDGVIAIDPGAGIRPAAAGAESYFDGILFVQTIPIGPCGYPHPFFACKWPDAQPIAGVDIPDILVGYAMLDANWNCSVDPGDYGDAAHELGHMLAHPNLQHPSNYMSRYELMDSGYDPNAAGVFTRWDSSLLDGRAQYFNGWLDASQIVEFDPTMAVGTEVLSPIELEAAETVSPQGLKVSTGRGDYYVVECRRPIWPDEGIPQTGAVIYHTIDAPGQELEMLGPPGTPMWTPVMPREATFMPGDAVIDDDADLVIAVGPDSGDGCTVTVAYGPEATAGAPDLGIIPWLTPPQNEYETIDLWVDSPCNGLHDPAAPEASALRYGLHSGFPDPTVVGNGDDPCVGFTNRMYARIRNLGTATTPPGPTMALFEVTNPLGVGIRGPSDWIDVGTVMVPGSLAPGDYVDVYVDWDPAVPPGRIIDRESFHSCMRVSVVEVTGEVVLTNQDGEREQENLNYFEARLDRMSGEYDEAIGEIVIANDDDPQMQEEDRTFYLTVDSHLPSGWTLELAGGQRTFVLPPGASQTLPVKIGAPSDAGIGERWSVDVSAYTPEPNPVRGGTEWALVSSLSIVTTAVIDVEIGLDAEAIPDWSQPWGIEARGCLTEALDGVTVMVSYADEEGQTFTNLVTTNSAGCFEDMLWQPWSGIWEVRAHWVGDDTHSRAVSNPVGVGIGVDYLDGCVSTNEPGCGEPEVEACVCAADPYCCAVRWDGICVGEVESLSCGSCGDPCDARSTPGAREAAMEACICPVDPYCCATAWDWICVAEVDSLGCGTC